MITTGPIKCATPPGKRGSEETKRKAVSTFEYITNPGDVQEAFITCLRAFARRGRELRELDLSCAKDSFANTPAEEPKVSHAQELSRGIETHRASFLPQIEPAASISEASRGTVLPQNSAAAEFSKAVTCPHLTPNLSRVKETKRAAHQGGGDD